MIFKDKTDKRNYAIFENQNGVYLKYNIFKNIWVSIREHEIDNEMSIFHTINLFKISIPTFLLILLTIIVALLFSEMNIIVITTLSILSIFIIFFFSFYLLNTKIKYFSDMHGAKWELEKYLTKIRKFNKKVMIFTKDGEEITGKQLERKNKFKNVI